MSLQGKHINPILNSPWKGFCLLLLFVLRGHTWWDSEATSNFAFKDHSISSARDQTGVRFNRLLSLSLPSYLPFFCPSLPSSPLWLLPHSPPSLPSSLPLCPTSFPSTLPSSFCLPPPLPPMLLSFYSFTHFIPLSPFLLRPSLYFFFISWFRAIYVSAQWSLQMMLNIKAKIQSIELTSSSNYLHFRQSILPDLSFLLSPKESNNKYVFVEQINMPKLCQMLLFCLPLFPKLLLGIGTCHRDWNSERFMKNYKLVQFLRKGVMFWK